MIAWDGKGFCQRHGYNGLPVKVKISLWIFSAVLAVSRCLVLSLLLHEQCHILGIICHPHQLLYGSSDTVCLRTLIAIMCLYEIQGISDLCQDIMVSQDYNYNIFNYLHIFINCGCNLSLGIFIYLIMLLQKQFWPSCECRKIFNNLMNIHQGTSVILSFDFKPF